MNIISRRHFLETAVSLAVLAGTKTAPIFGQNSKKGTKIRTGLCTYLWGTDMSLPELLAVCEKSGVDGLELRIQHKHGVEPEISAEKRAEVKKMFADSPVTLVGFGTNEDFHHTDPEKVRQHIERAKEYVRLSADCGGLGAKVKPNDLPKGVERAKTTAQIAAACEELGKFAAELGQEIRLENHGGCAPIPIMKEIIEQVSSPNVGLCWNCNGCDMDGAGFVENFKSVRTRLARTAHVHDIPSPAYPYEEMIPLLVEQDWDGWLLFECSNKVEDVTSSMTRLRGLYEEMITRAAG